MIFVKDYSKFLFSIVIISIVFNLVSACSSPNKDENSELTEVSLDYATGFTIEKGDDFWIVKVTKGWTGADRGFSYLVLQENARQPDGEFDAVVQLPVDKIIVTSTTHIPHLDMLDADEKLIGFPQLDLISSPKMWQQISAGKVKDLGAGPSANTEMLIDLDPGWIMFSTLGEDLKYLDLLAQSNIPALINGEYVEQHPLGRAEWIKFTGVMLGKFEEAKKVFESIENSYLEAEKLTQNLPKDSLPSILSGVMYQDIWYAPGAESWGAKILQNAGGDYVFSDQLGFGSVQLNYEFVLDNAIETEFWIGSADFSSVEAMGNIEPRYRAFAAWKNGNVYSYTQKKGPKGGLEYFELGYMRPDLILKDLVKILHPSLLPDYELYFYRQLNAKD